MCGPGIPCEVNYGLDGICSDLVIDSSDLIVSGTQETYSICKQKGITHIIYLGLHTNMCLFGRPEALQAMYGAGLDCMLARDLNDAFTHYDPTAPFTPDDGTARIDDDLERAGIPTINIVEEMKKAGRWRTEWVVDPVRITPWGTESRPYLFEKSVTVALTCPFLPGTQIRYTLDGSEPTAQSKLYEKPFPLIETARLRAAAFRDGQEISLVGSGYFVKLGPVPPKPDIYLDQVEPIRENYPYWYSSWRPVLEPVVSKTSRLLMRGKHLRQGRGHAGSLKHPLPNQGGVRPLCSIGRDRRPPAEPASRFLRPVGQWCRQRLRLSARPATQRPVPAIHRRPGWRRKARHSSSGHEPWRFDVRIPPGSRQINLTVTDAGSRSVLDLADWVEAGFVLKKNGTAQASSVPWDEPVDPDYHHASAEAYERFRDWKFGIRIHWGVYCIAPIPSNASWSLYDHDLDYQGKYHQLYKQFNPTAFDADEWMKLFERAGIKYFTFTTKHHDGFSMWDTKTRVKRRYVFSGAERGQDRGLRSRLQHHGDALQAGHRQRVM